VGFPKVLSDGGDWVIIYTVLGKGPMPIHGAYWAGEEYGWLTTQWTREGYKNPPNQSGLNITKIINSGELRALFPQEEEKRPIQIGP
jgi:hypothetical protein